MMEDVARRWLEERGLDLEALALLVADLQRPYIPDLRLEECRQSLAMVLTKREVQFAILTGLTLDYMAETGVLIEPLLSIVREDHPLYGVDEVLALSIVNVYGSIGLSNFGYLSKQKPGYLGQLRKPGRVTTFLDDIAAALVAAACARLAHRAGPGEEE